jgi:hypothetical protein
MSETRRRGRPRNEATLIRVDPDLLRVPDGPAERRELVSALASLLIEHVKRRRVERSRMGGTPPGSAHNAANTASSRISSPVVPAPEPSGVST